MSDYDYDYDYTLFDPDGNRVDVRDLFVEWLDCEPWPTVLGIEFSPDDVLLTLDPFAYKKALLDFYHDLITHKSYTLDPVIMTDDEDDEDKDDEDKDDEDKDDEVTE